MSKLKHRITFVCVLVMVLSAASFLVCRYREERQEKKPYWITADEKIISTFLDDSVTTKERFDLLFSYFVSGFLYYKTEDGASANYPGEQGWHGKKLAGMEAFTRILPLISAWICSGRSVVVRTVDGEVVNLLEIARRGLTSGTNPKSPGYWGHMEDDDLRICEAADVALSIWLLNHSLWTQLDSSEKQMVVSWLLEVNGKEVTDNNWHIFPVLVNEVVRSLGYQFDKANTENHYNRFKSFYRGNGWFSDGPNDIFDLYNAWGIHYALFWLRTINPNFDPIFMRQVSVEFLDTYKYFFSPAGFPVMGRSICYRMAAPAPLIFGCAQNQHIITPGVAKRALDCTWKYFITKGALGKGTVTQGYCGEDLRLLDNYSGPASCLWSLRSLVIAFYYPPDSAFWTASYEFLPVEKADYEILIPAINWVIKGAKHNGEVKIIKLNNVKGGPHKMENYGYLQRAVSLIRGKPNRPKNWESKYNLPEYSSSRPFCGCND